MLAMALGKGDVLIKDAGLLNLGCELIAFSQHLQEFVLCLRADLGVHRLPPKGG